jgi:hypothetical protein
VSIDVWKRSEGDEEVDKLFSFRVCSMVGISRPACKKVAGKEDDLTYAAFIIPNRPGVLSFFHPSMVGSQRTIHSSPPI